MNTPNESNSQERALTTTSYAVLAVLALREHSTYELAKQMQISMRYMWPRAESNVYAESKRLVAAGLAASRKAATGRRPRTLYSITPAGRAELRVWLASPSSRQRYESEAVLQVFFAENGTLEDVLATIGAVREEARAAMAHFAQFADLYAVGEGRHPERFALSALVARLLGEQHATTARWADWAEEVVTQWGAPSVVDVEWGIETIRATGAGFKPPP
jgi:PadR family transcriptional regulator AphA